MVSHRSGGNRVIPPELIPLRAQILKDGRDVLDDVAKRNGRAREIGAVKRAHGDPIVVDTAREHEVIADLVEYAKRIGVSEQAATKIALVLLEEGRRVQQEDAAKEETNGKK